MPCWPVMYQDGIYQVTDRDGIAYPILMAGAPVRQLSPGWYPTGLQTGLPPFHLLELRHDADHEDAVWYLNDELEFITHTSAHFRQQDIDGLVAGLLPLLRDIDAITVRGPRPEVAPSSHSFDGISPFLLRDLIGVVVNAAVTPPDVVLTDSLLSVSRHYSAASLTLSTSMLSHSLKLAAAAAGGGPMLVSPFDSQPLQAQEDCVPGGGALDRMLRFHDTSVGVTMYLGFRHDDPPALYIPVMNTIFTTESPLSGAAMLTTLFSYYAVNTPRSLPEAQAPMPQLVSQAQAELAPEPEPEAEAEPEPQPEPEPGPVYRASPVARDLPPNWWKRVFGLGHP